MGTKQIIINSFSIPKPWTFNLANYYLIVICVSVASVQSQSTLQNCTLPDKYLPPVIKPVLPSAESNESNELPNGILNEVMQTNISSVWSKLIFKNCKVRVEFWCNASYPIEWVEVHTKDSELLTDTDSQIHKDIWTDRIVNESLLGHTNSSEHQLFSFSAITNNAFATSYTAFLGLLYKPDLLCVAANYSCRSVNDPCLQSNVISYVNSVDKTISYQVSALPMTDVNEQDNIKDNSTCETYIQVTSKYGYFGWGCAPTHNQYFDVFVRNCDGGMHCNSFFVHQKQARCLKRLSADEECFHCRYKNTSNKAFHPGHVWCEDSEEKIVTALQYFFSVPQTLDPKVQPELYLDWSEADPQKMLYIQPIEEEGVYLNQTITVICRISRYYFSYGHRFGFGFNNGSVFSTPSIDGYHEHTLNVNEMNVTILVDDASLRKVYCFAPVWNSATWINQSIDIRVSNESATIPSVVVKVGSKTFKDNWNDHEVSFEAFQHNVTLTCLGKGQPLPEVKWIMENNNEVPGVIINDVGPGRKDLVFTYVTYSMKGIVVTCESKNFVGANLIRLIVTVRDPFALFWRLTTALFFTVVVAFLVALAFCWRKLQNQKRQLQALTEAEIKEFREGNVEILETTESWDTQELLYALPYNDDYEIPFDRLYIDTTAVLGSGNFGQVVKGAVLDKHNGRKIVEVAVKTVKPNLSLLHFKTLLSEVKIMAHIGKHTNVVSLVGACTANIRKGQIYVAVEFCPEGSLETFLKNCRPTFVNLIRDDTIYITTSMQILQNHTYQNCIQEQSGQISTRHLLKFSRDIANGCEWLVSKKIVHGDLSARNILLSQGIAKIGDFGLSRKLLDYSNYASSDVDCLLPWKYLAIETLKDMKFSAKSDVWSYGVTLWEIFSLAEIPYPGITWNPSFLKDISDGLRLDKPRYANHQIYSVMLECWSLEPSQRPTFMDLKDEFEGLLLQTINDVYVDTNFTYDREISNGSPEQRVHNPGYSILGVTDTSTNDNNFKRKQASHNPDKSVSLMSGDIHGYLTPLMFENFEIEED